MVLVLLMPCLQWAAGPEAAGQLAAWKRGQTGFPLVDAGEPTVGGDDDGGAALCLVVSLLMECLVNSLLLAYSHPGSC